MTLISTWASLILSQNPVQKKRQKKIKNEKTKNGLQKDAPPRSEQRKRKNGKRRKRPNSPNNVDEQRKNVGANTKKRNELEK